jgi:hypothetical protein
VLEAADPEKLAARWGEVLAARPQPDAGGGFALALEHGTRVRFLPNPDAIEPALVGVEVALRDRARFDTEARAAGLHDPAGSARIAGTRIVPV